MNHKVLLADDSLTIQKVIKITLANQPYDISECASEEELFKKLPEVKPKIVFLDFNLSEKYTGYELTSKIKSAWPAAKVLLLLGTFDSVDDEALERCGASDKIVKPFDSNKFIAICKRLVDSEEPEESSGSTFPSDDDLEMPGDDNADEAPEDQWQMSNSALKTEDVRPEMNEPISKPTPIDALTKEMSDWGMSVPNVINEQSHQEIRVDLPPILGEVKSLEEQRQKVEASKVEEAPKAKPESKAPAAASDIKYPDNGDLDYPTIEELQAGAPKSEAAPASAERKPSQLVSIDVFNDAPTELELEGNYVEDTADVSSIEAQIRDEVEENLWQADEFEDLKKEVSAKIEEMTELGHSPKAATFDEELFRPIDDPQSIDWAEDSSPAKETPAHEPAFSAAMAAPTSRSDLGELRKEMEEMIKKYVHEYMDQMFQKNVEKITWEVIPDLAENLIRQELGKIANKVMNDQE